MATGVPRFRPIHSRNWSDNSTDVDTPSQSDHHSIGSEFDGNSGVVSHVLSPSYRIKVACLSGACFAVGTGYSIFTVITGR